MAASTTSADGFIMGSSGKQLSVLAMVFWRSPDGLHVVVVVVALDVVAVMVVVVMVGNQIWVAVAVVVVRLGVLYFSGIYAVMINDRWRSSTMISLL